LAFNLVMNLFYIGTATGNIILRVPTIGFGGDLANQTFNAAFCLVGLPFIFAAFYGVAKRQESHVRLYLYYLILSFILDLGYVAFYLAVEDPSNFLPGALKKHGAAFAMGFARIFIILFVVLLTSVQLYCMFTVWSLAEDIRVGGSTQGFPELLQAAKVGGYGAYAGVDPGSIFGTGDAGGGYGGGFARPLHYGSLATPGIGGGAPIFGSNHDVNYPPKQGSAM
jgi:hypothetical protein